MTRQSLLRVEGVSKRFPGVLALDHVDFDLRPGEVHALIGENGAGKSTLVKVLAGSFRSDGGRIFLDGQELALKNPHHASTLGIRVVFQELSLVPQLSVAENLFLGRETTRRGLLHKRAMVHAASAALARVGARVDPRALAGALGPAQRYLVEIAKATLDDVRVLILDEPTASLTAEEAGRLFELCDELRRRGVGIIYVTHRLEELPRVAGRVTVLRDGRHIVTLPIGDVDQQRLITFMTGREFREIFPALAPRRDAVRLRVRDLSVPARLDRTSFDLGAGEILGVAGLIGCGKSELGRALFGLEPDARGSVVFDGDESRPAAGSPRWMIRHGVMYFPADRRREGLVLCRPVLENMTLPALWQFERAGFLRKSDERRAVRGLVERLQIRAPGMGVRTAVLSGGTQQKVMLARGLIRDVEVFIFDEPTQGIDVGAKVDLYHFIRDLAAQGASVVLISSDMAEILHMCHRVLVLYRGRPVALLGSDDLSEATVLRHYFGETAVEAPAHA